MIIYTDFALPAHYFLSNYLKWYNFKKCRNASAAYFLKEQIGKTSHAALMCFIGSQNQ